MLFMRSDWLLKLRTVFVFFTSQVRSPRFPGNGVIPAYLIGLTSSQNTIYDSWLVNPFLFSLRLTLIQEETLIPGLLLLARHVSYGVQHPAEVKDSSLTSGNQISFTGLAISGNYKDRNPRFSTQYNFISFRLCRITWVLRGSHSLNTSIRRRNFPLLFLYWTSFLPNQFLDSSVTLHKLKELE